MDGPMACFIGLLTAWAITIAVIIAGIDPAFIRWFLF